MQYMKAKPVARAKEVRDDGSIVDISIWQLEQPLVPCTHFYKYRLYFGAHGICRIRYDNELGKGDHRHLGEIEIPYEFVSVLKLLADFENDVNNWRT
jgi:Family of unknown function (DUF6516)